MAIAFGGAGFKDVVARLSCGAFAVLFAAACFAGVPLSVRPRFWLDVASNSVPTCADLIDFASDLSVLGCLCCFFGTRCEGKVGLTFSFALHTRASKGCEL